MKKFSLSFNLFLLICCFSILGYSQDHSSVMSSEYEARLIPDNPNVSSLGSFGFQPIDKYTGTANISIPLHTLELDGLQIPLIASYNTGGITVAQEASWIGLGWNLGAGGYITNEINGFDDTKGSNSVSGQPLGYIHTKDYITRDSSNNYEPRITVEDQQDLVSANQSGVPYDTEPDIFTVNLFGREVKFVLRKLAQDETLINAKVIGTPNVKVIYDSASGNFEITDAAGFIYYFNHVEYSTNYSNAVGTYSASLSEDEHIKQIHSLGNSIHDIERDKISWQISAIRSPQGNELFFEYDRTLNISHPSISEQISYECNLLLPQNVSPQPFVHEIDYSSDHTARFYVLENVVLKRIYGDFGSIDFTLDNRADLFGLESYRDFISPAFFSITAKIGTPFSTESPKKLSQIQVKDPNGQLIKNIAFDQSYFNNAKLADPNKERYLRLKLDALTINEQTYRFGYINCDLLPSKISKDTDFWGFFNGALNTDRIPKYGRFNASYTYGNAFEYFVSYDKGNTRKSDFTFGSIGLLNRIFYPTGGSTQYTYEGNVASVKRPQPYNPQYDQNGDFARSKIFNSEDYQWNFQYLKMANDENYSFADYNTSCLVNLQSIDKNEEFTISNTNICDKNYNVEVTTTIQCVTGCQGQFSPSGPATWIRNTDTNQVYDVFNFSGYGQNGPDHLREEILLPAGNYRFEYNASWSTTTPAVVINGSSLRVLSEEIINPSGTVDSFEEFEVGGARVQSVTEFDLDGQILGVREFGYLEEKPNGSSQSSGILMDQLVFHSKNNGYFSYTPEGYYANSINLHSSNMLRTRNSASGHHLGYSTVTERRLSSENQDVDNGEVVCTYINEPNEPITRFVGTTPPVTNQSWPDIYYSNVYLNGVLPKSFAYKNGQLSTREVFSTDGTTKQKTTNEYLDTSTGSYISDSYPHISYQFYVLPSGCPVTLCGYFPQIPYFKPITTNEVNDSRVSRLTKMTDETILNGQNLFTVTDYEYEKSIHLLPTAIKTTNSKGELITQKSEYPQDLPSEYLMSDLIAENRVNMPIKQRSFIGTTSNPEASLISQQETRYEKDVTTNDIVLPKTVSSKKGQSQLENRLNYEAYDNKGNPIEVKVENGISVAYIWGYEREYVVAKIENAEAGSISSYVSNIQNLSDQDNDRTADTIDSNGNINYQGNEGALRQALNGLRTSQSGSMVTTYTYDPLVGVTSMTDPRGYTIYYKYDSSNRLNEVRDRDNNLVTDYDYQYVTFQQN